MRETAAAAPAGSARSGRSGMFDRMSPRVRAERPPSPRRPGCRRRTGRAAAPRPRRAVSACRLASNARRARPTPSAASTRLDAGGDVRAARRRCSTIVTGVRSRRRPRRDPVRGRRVRRLGDQHDVVGAGVGVEHAAARCIALRPPTRSDRSRPPTPSTCETRTPASSSRQVSCCAPVPEAATTPTRGPASARRRTLAKPRPTPPMIAVPQSGPITRTPAARGRVLQGELVLERHVVGEDHHVPAGVDGVHGLAERGCSRNREQHERASGCAARGGPDGTAGAAAGAVPPLGPARARRPSSSRPGRRRPPRRRRPRR